MQSNRMRVVWTVAMTVACAVTGGMAAAEEDVGEVIVSATRTERRPGDLPVAASVVRREEITRRTDGVRLDQVIGLTPGVEARNRFLGDDSRFMIRGQGARASFGVRGVAVLIDGVPLTGADGQTRLEPIDPLGLERVEITRGPAGSVWGGGSVGGVMNFVTRRPGPEPVAEIFGNVGEFGFHQEGARFSGLTPSGFGYSVTADHADIEGYRRHGDWEASKLNANLYVPIDPAEEEELRLFVQATSVNLHHPGYLTDTEVRADPRQADPREVRLNTGRFDDRVRFGGTYSNRGLWGWADDGLEVSAFVTARQIDHPLSFAYLDINSNGYYGAAKWTHPFSLGSTTHSLLVGIEDQQEATDQVQRANSNGVRGAEQNNTRLQSGALGAYLQDEFRLTDRLSGIAGVRWDEVRYAQEDRFVTNGRTDVVAVFNDWSPRAGLVLRAHPRHSLFANYGQAFEPPTSGEVQNTDAANNGPLRPQRGRQYEVGARGEFDLPWLAGPARYEVSGYDLRVADFLVSRTVGFQSVFRNAARAEDQGVEVALGFPITDRLDLWTVYAWQDHRFASADALHDKRIPGVPEHVANAELVWRTPIDGLSARAQGRYAGTMFVDDANTRVNDAYATLDLGLSFDRPRWSANVTVENVTDERYVADVRVNDNAGRYYAPSPERNVRGGLTWRF